MILLNDTAYNEFKELLDEANVESYNIRIGIDNYSCSGPIFGISVSEATDEDEVETIKEITFFAEKPLIEQFGGFIIVSNDENNGYGVGLKPIVQPASSCGGGCGEGGGCGDSCGCDGECH
ncbi:MAG: HesB-like protein [Sedimentibacter sp.]